MPVETKSFDQKRPGVRLGRNCVVEEDDGTLRVTISPYRGGFSSLTYVLFALFLFGFLFVFSQVPGELSPVDCFAIFLFTCLLTSWLYFIVTTVAMKQVIHLDSDHFTVTKTMFFTFSKIQVGVREAHAIIIAWIEGKAHAPIFINCVDREIVLAQWLHDSDQAREVYDRLARRLSVKRLRRRLRPVVVSEPGIEGTRMEWVLEEFEDKVSELKFKVSEL